MSIGDRDRECPRCDTAALGEWDPVLHLYHCETCSATWRRQPGRLVPNYRPGPVVPLDLARSEWPDEDDAA